jgi:hypothetical protein
MNRCALVATHHKTGTVWMTSTFRDICKKLELRFINSGAHDKFTTDDIEPPVVIVDGHGFRKFSDLTGNPGHRIFHLIRDPRDVIVSGMRYHCVASESWLHVPKRKFGGLTYQTKLQSLADDRERLLLELENTRAITEMLRWKSDPVSTFECRYEDLICDREMNLFTRIAEHLGFAGSEIEVCRDAYWRYYIFGGMPEKKLQKSKHVLSGGARQWPRVFDREIGDRFVERYGGALAQLGYEPDDSWIYGLPARCDESLAAAGKITESVGNE